MAADTSPVPAFTPQQVEQLRRELGARRPRRGRVLAVAAVVLVCALVGAGGFMVGRAHPRVITYTRTVARVVTHTRVRWRTRTVTQQAAPSIPCQDVGGSPSPGVITAGMPGDTSCAVALLSPMGADHLAQVQLTAPNGDASTWNLANPYG